MDKKEHASTSSSSENEDIGDSEYMVYCHLCHIGFAGTVPYRQHLKGSKHQKKETKEFMKKKYGSKYLKAVATIEEGEKNADAGTKEPVTKIGTDGDDDDALVLICNVCKKACTGHIPFQLHLASKKHKKQVNKQEIIRKLKQDKNADEEGPSKKDPLYDILPQLTPFATCPVCKKSFSGPEGYEQHLSSESHKKEVQRQNLIKDMEESGAVINKVEDGDDEAACFATCPICGKGFSGPVPYQQHMISETHKNKEKERALTEKVKHMMITDDEGSIQCAECGKMFSGPKPLYQHLIGPAHSKQKKRDSLLKDLVDKYPEFLKDSTNPDDEDSDSDHELLVCTICHKCFSGPQSAKDHFLSKKHLKAKKEKERIDKLKTEKKTAKNKSALNGSVPDEAHFTDIHKSVFQPPKGKNPVKVGPQCNEDDFEVL